MPFHRLNTDLDPSLSYDPAAGTLTVAGRDVSDLLTGRVSVWTRGLRRSAHRDDVDQYVADEGDDFLMGVFAAAPAARWMSHPARIRAASLKCHQLRLAAELGLAVPKTLVTNTAGAARAHLRDRPAMVAKPVTGRLISTPDGPVSVFTAALEEADLARPDERVAPFCAQERLRGRDVRVTVVGTRVHAVAITVDRDVADWRTAADSEVRYEEIPLPAPVRDRLLRLVGSYGLRYSAIDLRESDGVLYFLELNPAGQWGWLERATGLPLTRAIVDELLAVP